MSTFKDFEFIGVDIARLPSVQAEVLVGFDDEYKPIYETRMVKVLESKVEDYPYKEEGNMTFRL